jgi:hypothetical protein
MQTGHIQLLLMPKNTEITLKHPQSHRVGYLDNEKQESMTKSGQIRDAHEILGLACDRPVLAYCVEKLQICVVLIFR